MERADRGRSERVVVRQYTNLDTWKPGYLDTWILGYLDTWLRWLWRESSRMSEVAWNGCSTSVHKPSKAGSIQPAQGLMLWTLGGTHLVLNRRHAKSWRSQKVGQ